MKSKWAKRMIAMLISASLAGCALSPDLPSNGGNEQERSSVNKQKESYSAETAEDQTETLQKSAAAQDAPHVFVSEDAFTDAAAAKDTAAEEVTSLTKYF